VQFSADYTRVTASNGHLIVMATAPGPLVETHAVSLSKRSVDAIVAILGEAEDARYTRTPGNVCVEAQGRTIIVRPHADKTFPDLFTGRPVNLYGTVDRNKLLAAVGRVMTTLDPIHPAITITTTAIPPAIVVSAERATEYVDVESVDCDLPMTVKAHYLRDAIAHAQEGPIQVGTIGDGEARTRNLLVRSKNDTLDYQCLMAQIKPAAK
jgi:hypothetical protein